jgi:hypothetical protein
MFTKLLSRLRRDPDAHLARAETTPYRAVSVIPTRASCPAAIAARDVRFLVADAPALPLPMCTWPLSCTCTFRYHEDRRVTVRRAGEPGEAEFRRKDRRQSFGRRVTDQ